MYVRHDAASSDCRLNEPVKFFVAADGQLKMAWGDTFDTQIFGRVTGQLEHLCHKVFQNGRQVDGRRGAHPAPVRCPFFQVAVESTYRELETGSRWSRRSFRFRFTCDVGHSSLFMSRWNASALPIKTKADGPPYWNAAGASQRIVLGLTSFVELVAIAVRCSVVYRLIFP